MFSFRMFIELPVPENSAFRRNGVSLTLNCGTKHDRSLSVTCDLPIVPSKRRVLMSGFPFFLENSACMLLMFTSVFGRARLKSANTACLLSYARSNLSLRRSSPELSFNDSFFTVTDRLSAV